MLRAADVHFAYRDSPVLRGLTLDVPAGGVLGILGPNGSGKTTLLRLLAGTLRPASGVVSIDGVSLSRLGRTTLARRMAVVPQETQLAFDYSVLEVVLMGRYPHLGPFEVEGPDDLAAARAALASTGTAHLEGRTFATLSGGEKQRVVIAGALAQLAGPGIGVGPVLLLDEPTTALDLAYQLELAALLGELHRRHPLTIIVSTHDLNFAASVCSDLVLLSAGRILAAGPTDRVLTRDNVGALYGVDADVAYHALAGHLVVVPVSRISAGADG